MSKKSFSYPVLVASPADGIADGAKSTGTSHTLTMWVDAANKTVKISCGSLSVVNGDQVVWDFKDKDGNPLTGKDLKIVFSRSLTSGPKGPNATKITLDISEDDDSKPLKSYTATYSVTLDGESLTVTDDGISPQLVIDKVGKPPAMGGGDCDDDDDEDTGHHRRRRHHAG